MNTRIWTLLTTVIVKAQRTQSKTRGAAPRPKRGLGGPVGLVLLTAILTGCGREVPPPAITFAPWGQPYAEKPDFASVERRYPLSAEDRMKITPENIASLAQEEVDQIYARLTAGPIPDGPFEGNLFFPKGASGEARLVEIARGEGTPVVNLRAIAAKFKVAKLETLGRVLWKGKVFYRDERVLRNRIEDLAVLKPLISGDLRDIPKIKVDRSDAWLMFPAKLYCGQSLLDGRRESIIIDYAFTDEIDGYRERPDYLAGRNGFMVRDEIRMVRPGFYLGRAYMHRFFVLNFTLYNADIANRESAAFITTGKVAETCWPGEQQRVLASSAR